MLPKLIISDMDGTSLDQDRFHMRPSTYDGIMKAISMGCMYVPATGRSLSLVPGEKLPPFRYIITSNGAVITDVTDNRIIYADYFTREEGIAAWEIVRDYPGFMELFIRNQIVMEKRLYSQMNQWDIPEFHRIMVNRQTPVLVNSLKESVYRKEPGIEKLNMPRVEETFRTKYRKELLETGFFRIPPSYDTNIEATRKTADKGTAALWLFRYLGISQENVMAFGDDGNDTLLLSCVGCGIAMGDGHPDAIAAAKYRTEKGDKDGIARFLESYLKG